MYLMPTLVSLYADAPTLKKVKRRLTGFYLSEIGKDTLLIRSPPPPEDSAKGLFLRAWVNCERL
jgi:hypothetical protein